jgi:hypothetical protein
MELLPPGAAAESGGLKANLRERTWLGLKVLRGIVCRRETATERVRMAPYAPGRVNVESC